MTNAVLASLAYCALCAPAAASAQNECSTSAPRVRADEGNAPADLSYAKLLDVLDAYRFAGCDDERLVRVVPETRYGWRRSRPLARTTRVREASTSPSSLR